LKEKIRIN